MHTVNSHDGKQTVWEACESAIAKGISGISVTDHADTWFFEHDNTLVNIAQSVERAKEADEKYKGRLRVFHGVEIGEPLSYTERTAKLFEMNSFDLVIGSVHSVVSGDIRDSYSRINFDRANKSDEEIHAFLEKYFTQMYEMTVGADFDILAHLSCPLRYINGKYDRHISLDSHLGIIDEILAANIERGRSLEINTSGIGTAFGQFMPDAAILGRYRKLGGKMITFGTDAHESTRIGCGLAEAAELARSLGFDRYNYYENRKAISVRLD